MKSKLINTNLALVFCACIGFAQNNDTLTTKSDKKPIKVSFLSNYYEQDGNRGATNGGIGSQELYSYTNEATIYLPVKKKIGIKLNGGVDYYTAASYLDIDKYKTSASSGNSGVSSDETRKYGGIGLDINNKDESVTAAPYFGVSKEYDVNSYTFGYTHSIKNKEKNSALTFKASAIIDRWMLIYPGEFRTASEVDASSGASDKGTKIHPNVTPIEVTGRTITKDGKTYGVDYRYSGALGSNYAFAINKKMNGLLGVDGILQKGMLSTPYYRVYFRDGVTDEYTKLAKIEKLPEQRYKIALYARYNWFMNKLVVMRSSVRLYKDDWGINSFTFDAAFPVKVTKQFSFAPFYRFHTQTASKFFAGYGRHELSDVYYTSDFDLANVHSNKFGGTIRFVPFRKLINIKSLDLRYAQYFRSDGLKAGTVSAEVNFEF